MLRNLFVAIATSLASVVIVACGSEEAIPSSSAVSTDIVADAGAISDVSIVESECSAKSIPSIMFEDNFEDAKIEFFAPDRVTVLSSPSFDSQGVRSLWNINAEVSLNDPDAVTITNAAVDGEGVARLGNHAVRFIVDYSDNVSGGNRSEISYRKQSPEICSEGYYAWSFKLDKNYVEDGNFQTVGQFHAAPVNGEAFETLNSPNPIFMDYYGGELRLILRSPPDFRGEVFAAQAISRDTWVDVIFHVKWAQSYEGFIEAWIRTDPGSSYNRMLEKTSIPTVNNAAGNYIKLGLYRSLENVSTRGVIYFDEFRIGNSLAGVAIGMPPEL